MFSVQDLPKAELHLHLEGSVEPETLHEMAPELTLEEIRARYQYKDFDGFIESFKWVNSFLKSPEDYALVTTRLLESLARQNVTYAEIILAAGVILWKKQDFAGIYDAVRGAAAKSPVRTAWILDAVRQFGPEEGMQVAQLAVERVADGVVAIGIGGTESRGPAHWFKEMYAFAKSKGLHLTAHAGETTGPDSVWAALKIGAERIGHGIRSIDDPALVRHLRDNNIPLEVCITGNVATGAVPTLDAHPVRKLFDAGVPIVLNSDDPAMFHTTLNHEYKLALSHFGFSASEIEQIAGNSLRYSFA